mmetsp:Transcript_30213/g.54714  ORF Transcript_30213/g.54714 Transcript_30213/m.54714 type:complete len:121 (-) Transcript_30213:189-551(-)|eukprot:CAMPEP_0201887158 /NCGR_PEP_ID=MMETSP0902-20130614/24244_1 /ASSEMBLY_ACC=CAM_ASM_000551 /TAXON_ID=420261 /ORGANISM="Thalassiosira antarctica, Strain CCMP982" /LENGTH=120 /DNA_ID=CAMNT_0048417003 /DNA_START=44 /DNA_END=406 /DNA_ORIENTATION=+
MSPSSIARVHAHRVITRSNIAVANSLRQATTTTTTTGGSAIRSFAVSAGSPTDSTPSPSPTTSTSSSSETKSEAPSSSTPSNGPRLHSTDIAFKPAESGWGGGSKYTQRFDAIFGSKKKE